MLAFFAQVLSAYFDWNAFAVAPRALGSPVPL
jgi:hypothetical protein